MTEEQNKLAGRSADPEFEHEAPETQGTWQERCAALYQVVGCMAHMFGVFESSDDVSDALDVAAGRGDVEKLLPWPKVDLCKLADREPATEAVLEEALEEAAKMVEAIAESHYACGSDQPVGHTLPDCPFSIATRIRALKGKGASQGVDELMCPMTAQVCYDPRAQCKPGYCRRQLAPEPSGEFVRVPREPTEAQRHLAMMNDSPSYRKNSLTFYCAMLAAADEQKG